MTSPINTSLSAAAKLVAALVASSLALSSAQAAIEPAASGLAKSVSAKLGGAQTLRLSAEQRIDPRLGVGSKIGKTPIKITVRRPNQFHAAQSAGQDAREIAYDGKTLCVMNPELKHHALAPLKATSLEQFADRMDERFGFRPPIAELLANDMATQLFRDVTSARVIGREMVGWTQCDRLHFEQPGMTGDLWVGVKDKLPRRYLLTFTDMEGNPTWDVRLKKWELNAPVDASLFAKRPAADSHQLQMLKSR